MSIQLVSAAAVAAATGDTSIHFQRKSQKEKGSYNYYITPNCSIYLYDAVVMIADPKYIVLKFDKVKHASLLKLLNTISNQMIDMLKQSYPLSYKIIFPIYGEQQDTFTVRCSLPHVRNKYFIDCVFENETVDFALPRRNCVFQKIGVVVRNIWENKERIGFNIEIKSLTN